MSFEQDIERLLEPTDLETAVSALERQLKDTIERIEQQSLKNKVLEQALQEAIQVAQHLSVSTEELEAQQWTAVDALEANVFKCKRVNSELATCKSRSLAESKRLGSELDAVMALIADDVDGAGTHETLTGELQLLQSQLILQRAKVDSCTSRAAGLRKEQRTVLEKLATLEQGYLECASQTRLIEPPETSGFNGRLHDNTAKYSKQVSVLQGVLHDPFECCRDRDLRASRAIQS